VQDAFVHVFPVIPEFKNQSGKHPTSKDLLFLCDCEHMATTVKLMEHQNFSRQTRQGEVFFGGVRWGNP
jgi:hypothetical protein